MSQYWGVARWGSHQNVAYTGTAGTIATAIVSGTQKVRILTTSDAYVKVGVSPTATTSDIYVVALTPEYVSISGGEKVSAIQVSASGTLHVTECV